MTEYIKCAEYADKNKITPQAARGRCKRGKVNYYIKQGDFYIEDVEYKPSKPGMKPKATV